MVKFDPPEKKATAIASGKNLGWKLWQINSVYH